ncbi:Uncharacterised protein [Vibrio cholerae]|nr:Uncharacterised protein [Vibrio cholerae]
MFTYPLIAFVPVFSFFFIDKLVFTTHTVGWGTNLMHLAFVASHTVRV